MQRRVATLVQQVRTAARRRSADRDAADRLDAVLQVLEADHVDVDGDPDVLDVRLEDLRRVFALSPLDVDLLVVACAPDLDPNLGLAFALLQGDPSRTRPGVGLALELCGSALLSGAARARLGPSGPLRTHGLLDVVGDEPLPQRPLRVTDRLVADLVGDDTGTPAVNAMLVALPEQPCPGSADEPTGVRATACAAARAVEAGVPLVWLRSTTGSSALGTAVAVFDELDIACLAVDLRRRLPGTSLEAAVRATLLDAALRRCGLVLAGADLLTTAEHTWLLALLEASPVPVVAIAHRGWDASWLPRFAFAVDAPTTPVQAREALWRRELGAAHDATGPGWQELVSLRLTPEEIAQTARYAAVLAASRQEPVSVETMREAARRLSSDLSTTRRARSAPTFADLALPAGTLASLHELVDWAKNRDAVLGQGPLAGKGDKGRGIAALFAGAPGTGKTLAAHVIAGELGLDLHTVELSSIVDKYIGETEKNLQRVFDEAESLNVLLFFDEADALFGARSEVRDARDRYANQEVAYLLQRMEQFDGIAVLATNLRGNLDSAFSRRLHFIVHFPDPDVATRRHLWQAHLDAGATLDPCDPVDVEHLAQTVEVAGGDVRNIVLAAAYAATAQDQPLGMRHVVHAVVREYRKLGRRLPVPGLRLEAADAG